MRSGQQRALLKHRIRLMSGHAAPLAWFHAKRPHFKPLGQQAGSIVAPAQNLDRGCHPARSTCSLAAWMSKTLNSTAATVQYV